MLNNKKGAETKNLKNIENETFVNGLTWFLCWKSKKASKRKIVTTTADKPFGKGLAYMLLVWKFNKEIMFQNYV